MAGVDDSGAKKKLANMRRGYEDFASKITHDAGSFFLLKLTDEIINGAYVRRISGMLVRSQTLTPLRYAVKIAANLSIAPYAPSVAAKVFKREGHDYLRLTKFFYGDEIQEKASNEFRRLGKVVDSGEKYRYQNPF